MKEYREDKEIYMEEKRFIIRDKNFDVNLYYISGRMAVFSSDISEALYFKDRARAEWLLLKLSALEGNSNSFDILEVDYYLNTVEMILPLTSYNFDIFNPTIKRVTFGLNNIFEKEYDSTFS